MMCEDRERTRDGGLLAAAGSSRGDENRGVLSGECALGPQLTSGIPEGL